MPLPKKNRLSLRLHKDDFTSGQKYYGKYFTFIKSTIDHRSSTQPVFAVLVSKKTAKKAVDRNKIRRLTSSVTQKLLPQFSGGQYLLIPKSSVITAPFSELLIDLSSLLSRLK